MNNRTGARKKLPDVQTEFGLLTRNSQLHAREQYNLKSLTEAAKERAKTLLNVTKEAAEDFVTHLFDPKHKPKILKLTAEQMNGPGVSPDDTPTVPDIRQLPTTEAQVTPEDLAELEHLSPEVRDRLKTVLNALQKIPQSA